MASWASVIMGRGLATDATFKLNSTDDATNMLINDLVFAQSKSVRTSTIILASFNILAAFSTASSIVYDCYCASKRCNPKFSASKFCISKLHPAETFPLVLSVGIVIQGLIFAAAQGQGMQSLNIDGGCDIIAQFMLPAICMVPFIQVVFGLECALRSLRKLPFPARGKYDVTICIFVIFFMLIGSWVPTFLFKQPVACFASLLWFVSAFGTTTFLTLLIASILMVLSTITIFIRLSVVTLVDQHQRIAASRMVYYLVIGIMSLALVIPYFATQAMWPRGDIKLAMMGTVVVNLSGLMNGLLHLFLRSNTSTSAFGPKHSRHWARDKHEIRLWGPNELAFTNHLNDPVSGPQSPQSAIKKLRPESQASLMVVEKMGPIAMSSPPFRSPGKTPPFPITPLKATRTLDTTGDSTQEAKTRQHGRKKSYSLFPFEGPKSPGRSAAAVASVYDITNLDPPPKIKFGPGHRRDSSIISTATVQIGLRLSHAPGTEPTKSNDTAKLSMSSNSLLLPIAFSVEAPAASSSEPAVTLSSKTFGSTGSTYTPKGSSLLSNKFSLPSKRLTSPLQVITSVASTPRPSTPELPLRSPKRPVPTPLITSTIISSLTPSLTPESSSKFNKVLPPTPPAQLNPIVEALRISKTQLAPNVYSPNNQGIIHEKKGDLTPVYGLPSGPKIPKTPSSAGLSSPAAPNDRSPRSTNIQSEKKDWI